MLQFNERGRVYGEEIHRAIESKVKRFDLWLKEAMFSADLKEDKDFCRILHKSTGGRPKTQYEFTLDAAKEICLLERNEKGKEIRRWLIDLANKRENLETISIPEAALAFNVINCLKYVDNQKEALAMHRTKFVSDNTNLLDPKYIYADFAKYRTRITGWDKASVDKAIGEFIQTKSGYNQSNVMKSDMSTKLSIMDSGEAIRVAVLDILYSNDTEAVLASRFSDMCKKLAKQMKVTVERENTTNLLQKKENVENVRQLKLTANTE